jgi:hypothetical protein
MSSDWNLNVENITTKCRPILQVRISTGSVLMVRYECVCTKFVTVHTSMYQVCTSMYLVCTNTLSWQVQRRRAYLDSLSMDGAEVAVKLCPLPVLRAVVRHVLVS